MTNPITSYDANATEPAARYQTLSADQIHADMLGLLPPGVNRLALDVGPAPV